MPLKVKKKRPEYLGSNEKYLPLDYFVEPDELEPE